MRESFHTLARFAQETMKQGEHMATVRTDQTIKITARTCYDRIYQLSPRITGFGREKEH